MKKVLRVFLTRYTLRQKHYTETQEQIDFPSDVTPEAAYAELLTKFGSVLDGTKEALLFQGIKTPIAPDQYIKIDSHSVVDVDRPPVEIGKEFRAYETDLFDPITVRSFTAIRDIPKHKRK